MKQFNAEETQILIEMMFGDARQGTAAQLHERFMSVCLSGSEPRLPGFELFQLEEEPGAGDPGDFEREELRDRQLQVYAMLFTYGMIWLLEKSIVIAPVIESRGVYTLNRPTLFAEWRAV